MSTLDIVDELNLRGQSWKTKSNITHILRHSYVQQNYQEKQNIHAKCNVRSVVDFYVSPCTQTEQKHFIVKQVRSTKEDG